PRRGRPPRPPRWPGPPPGWRCRTRRTTGGPRWPSVPYARRPAPRRARRAPLCGHIPSSDHSVRLEGDEFVLWQAEKPAEDLVVVLTEERGPLDLDGGVRQLQRAADRLERAAFGVVDRDDHFVGDEALVLDELAGRQDRAAGHVLGVELGQHLPLAVL